VDCRQLKIDATPKTEFVVRWGTDVRHGRTHDGIQEENALELAADTWKNAVRKVRFTVDGWDDEEPEIEIVSPPKYTKWLYGLQGPNAVDRVQVRWGLSSAEMETEWLAEGDPLEQCIEGIMRNAHRCGIEQLSHEGLIRIELTPTCVVTVFTPEGPRTAEVLWHSPDEKIVSAMGIAYDELVRHGPVEGKQMQLWAVPPVEVQELSETEETMVRQGYIEEAREANARRIISERSEMGWYPDPTISAPQADEVSPEVNEDDIPAAGATDTTEDADDEDGLIPGREGWTPEGWPTRRQTEKHEVRAGWTATKIHLDRTWRGVWLSESADSGEVQNTAQERFRDRIQPPVEVTEEGPHEWRIVRSAPVDGAVRGDVDTTDG
jgi:hypothetical protein